MTLDATLQYSSSPPPCTTSSCRSITNISENLDVAVVDIIVLFKADDAPSLPSLALGRSSRKRQIDSGFKPACPRGQRAGRPARRLAVQQAATTAAQRAAAHFPGRGRLFVGRGKWKRADDTTTEWLNAAELLIIPPVSANPDNTPMSLGPPRQVGLEEIWLRRAGDVARGGEREELS